MKSWPSTEKMDVRWGLAGGPMPPWRTAPGSSLTGWYCATLRGGKLWCKLELELSDFSVKAFKPRCEKYGSEDCRDSHPLMMACRDDRAENNFHRAVAAYAPGLRVFTSTVRRLRVGGVFVKNAWEY